MELSKYVRVIPLDNGNVRLYNTMTRALIALPKEAVNGNDIAGEIGEANLSILRDMGFFATSEQIREKALAEIANASKLFISVELNHSCNLRCPYCYQGNDKSSTLLERKHLKDLVRYYDAVHEANPYTDLYLKVLGGEPTMAWESFSWLHEETRRFCTEKDIKYHLLVDTNGTRITELIELDGFDSILFTIPLSHRSCHDRMRFYSNGAGTYDDILCNATKLKKTFPNAKVVLRHNTDGENIDLFAEYVNDLASQCDWSPWVSLNYTADLNGGEFVNGLDYKQFVTWTCSEAIDLLLQAKLPVLTSPLTSIEECQWRSEYSLKLFSDGTVGACAMGHYESNRPLISEVLSETLAHISGAFSAGKQEKALARQEECLDCAALFLCGGTKRLPCMQAVDPGPCAHEASHNIDIEAFIATYCQAKDQGLGHLFVVFEGGEGYR